jgi:micrococcal nuclease
VCVGFCMRILKIEKSIFIGLLLLGSVLSLITHVDFSRETQTAFVGDGVRLLSDEPIHEGGRDSEPEHVVSPRRIASEAMVAPSRSGIGATYGTVVRVIDGDTIEVRLGSVVERVRYIGIDTPETVHPSKPVECFGTEASAYNKLLVEGKEVRLEPDVTDRDKYGRLLRYVYVGDVLVNEALVREGYAGVYTYPPDVKYDAMFRDAERVAREEARGLWSAECAEVERVVPGVPETGCTIKGNINANGEKIYHVKGCKSYEKTVITEGAGERWFCSEDEAREAGWRKALNCL